MRGLRGLVALGALIGCAPADGAELSSGDLDCAVAAGFVCSAGACDPLEDAMRVRLIESVVEACSGEHGVCVEDGVSWDRTEPGPGGQGRYRTLTTQAGVFSIAVEGELAGGFTYSSHQYVTSYVLMGRCAGGAR